MIKGGINLTKKEVKKQNKIFKAILNMTTLGKMQIRINTLEGENESLKETIKDELYIAFMKKLSEPMEIERLRAENKNLRQKNHLLREMLKEDKNSKGKKRK